MRSDVNGGAFRHGCLRLIACLAALITAGQASAQPLFPGQKFLVGNLPFSVAVADLDGDTIPDLVTANANSDDISVLLGNGDGCLFRKPRPSPLKRHDARSDGAVPRPRGKR